MLHPRDEQGAAAPAAPLRRAASLLSLGADAAKYGTGEPVDLEAVDAEISRVIGFLIARRRAELVRALAVRVARSHGSMSKWLCGESGDVLALVQELASIRSAIPVNVPNPRDPVLAETLNAQIEAENRALVEAEQRRRNRLASEPPPKWTEGVAAAI